MTTNAPQALGHVLQYYHYPVQWPTMHEERVSYAGSTHFVPVPCFGGGGTSTTVVHGPGAGALLNRERAERRASSAATVGGIVLLAAAGALAYVARLFSSTNKKLKEAISFQEKLDGPCFQERKEELKPIFERHIQVLKREVTWSKVALTLTAGIVACAVGGFMGGMFSVQWLITASIVTGVFLSATAIFAVVWRCTEDRSLPQEDLQTLLRHYQEMETSPGIS